MSLLTRASTLQFSFPANSLSLLKLALEIFSSKTLTLPSFHCRTFLLSKINLSGYSLAALFFVSSQAALISRVADICPTNPIRNVIFSFRFLVPQGSCTKMSIIIFAILPFDNNAILLSPSICWHSAAMRVPANDGRNRRTVLWRFRVEALVRLQMGINILLGGSMETAKWNVNEKDRGITTRSKRAGPSSSWIGRGDCSS